MATVRRFDKGATTTKKLLPNGWLKADALISRTGIQRYVLPDGSVVREYRPPEEVFDAESLASFAMVPVTDEHPPGLLDSSNARAYARGHLGEQVAQDGDKVRATVLITDADLVEAVLNGEKEQVSCGYTCDLDPTPGEVDGERYDVVQRRIRGNHVACTIAGRAGPEVRVLDRMDGVALDSVESPAIRGPCQGTDPTEELIVPVKIKIDGIDFEVAENVAQALDKERKGHADTKAKADSALDELGKAEKARADELEKLKARLDSAEGKVTRLDAWVPMCFGMRCNPGSLCCQACPVKAACASLYSCPIPGDPASGQLTMDSAKAAATAGQKEHADAIVAGAKARADLEAKAREILGAEAKLDGADLEIKRSVLLKLKPGVKLDGQSDTYVATAYDIAVADAADAAGQAGLAALRAAGGTRTDAKPEAEKSLEEIRADALKASESAYQKPTVGMSVAR